MYTTEVAWAQIIGTRKSQQDHAAVVSWPNGFRMLLLADGMGGHTGGDIASRMVLEAFRDHFVKSELSDMRERMIASLDTANKTLYQAVRVQPDLSGMGTTLIAVIYDGMSIQWLSIGDSPMWLIRQGEIKRINQNHSMSEILADRVAAGEMSSEDAAQSPLRTQLLEAVMGADIEMLDAPEFILPLAEGDWLILASDGVETCAEEEILRMAQQPAIDAEQFTAELLRAVNISNKPSQDNASLVVMHVLTMEVEEPQTVEPARGKSIEEPRSEY